MGKTYQTDVVDVLNTTTMKWKTLKLSQARQDIDTSKSMDKIVFAGGWYETDDRNIVYSDVVDVFSYIENKFLAPLKLFEARANMAVCDVEGKEIFFSGGVSRYLTSETYYSDTIDVYDPVSHRILTEKKLVLPMSRSHHGAACGDNMCMFGGGLFRGHYTVNEYPLYLSRVDVLNIEKWRQGSVDQMWSKQELKVPRHDVACAFHDHKICFAGGMSKDGKTSQLDCYFTLLGKWGAWQLSLARSHPIMLTFNTIFVIGGGLANGGTVDGGTMWQKEGQAMRTQRLDVFNGTVVWGDALSTSVEELAGAVTGNKFYFGGGINNLRRVTARVEILEMRTIKVAQPVHYRNEYPQWIPIGELLNATWTIPVEQYRI